MYFKFQIKPVAGKPEKEGDVIVRFTGMSEYLNVNDVLGSQLITRQGKQIQKFKTGIEVGEVNNNALIPVAEKENFKKQIENYRTVLADVYGEEELDPTNTFFWLDPNHGKLKISNNDLDNFYDTQNPQHALIYFNIMGGGYIDSVAPSREFAEMYRIPFYLETQTEYVSESSDSYLTKGQAYAKLTELTDTADNQALLYIGWVLHSDSKGFGGYNLSTPKSELFKMNAEYIEGKLNFGRKRDCPAKFVEISKSWSDGKVGRPRVMTEAYIKSAQHFSYINTDKDGRYSLPSGLQLGFNVDSAVDTLLKPKNSKEYEELRSFIEQKWAE